MNEEAGQIPKPDHVIPPQEKPLRTYESDVADVLAHKNISTASIAIAENRKQTGENRVGTNFKSMSDLSDSNSSSRVTKKILISLAAIILIIVGVIGAFYLYNMSPLAVQPVTPVIPVQPSIIPTDSRVGLSIDNILSGNIINSVKSELDKTRPNNTIEEIVFTQTKDNQKYRVSLSDMLNLFKITPPDILTRSLSDNWMFGIFTNNSGNKSVFMVATINYFQNAFAGMLQWESVMPDDLSQYLPVNGVIKGSFVDRIIQNKDVREFLTSDGKVLFLYSFIDNTKLVITGSESALIDILNRLEQNSFVR